MAKRLMEPVQPEQSNPAGSAQASAARTTAPPPVSGSGRIPNTKIPAYRFDSHQEVGRRVASIVASLMRERNSVGEPAVLGLVAGSTPLAVYRELIRLHQQEGLDFSRVIAFNLIEYHGLPADDPQSFVRWMQENFYKHVNIPPEAIHFPDGTASVAQVDEDCRRYEDAIRRAGGVDLMLLGLGRNGHLAFNEPFSVRHSRTRLCRLDPITRRDAASSFYSEENVPTSAITVGLGTLMEARKIIVIALGEHKASIVHDLLEGSITDRVPASYLQDHREATVWLDGAAADKLTAVSTPWVLGNLEWTPPLVKRATLWLASQTNKALLKLDDDDFREHNLHQLLRHYGPAHRLAQRVFAEMMETIEYHPAGKTPQKVICFSPHPDDDVISMGGTLIRLCEDGHEVHVAYMTSGNIAVFDRDAQRFADFVAEYNRRFGINGSTLVEQGEDGHQGSSSLTLSKADALSQQVRQSLVHKGPGQSDCPEVLEIKALIRWSEAKAGAKVCGCQEEYLHFLDLPFYRTGTIAKKPVGPEDVRIVRELIERLQPDQIYMAGDLSDPHGTHRMCAEAILSALWQIEEATGSRPETLLYRGAWQEYPIHQIEIAVPMSPTDLERKKKAIFCHESQKDDALFPGSDPRQFWQRAEDRNRNTADAYNRIGLPEYYAIEGFVKWRGEYL